MSDNNSGFVPENGDSNRPPSSLETTYECGHCGQEFETAADLSEHTIACDDADAPEGE